jgi:hypothetical protein
LDDRAFRSPFLSRAALTLRTHSVWRDDDNDRSGSRSIIETNNLRADRTWKRHELRRELRIALDELRLVCRQRHFAHAVRANE